MQPATPFYLFIPQDEALREEYEQGWQVTDIFPVNSVGIVTARDRLTIHHTEDDLWKTVRDFAALPVEEARQKYKLGKDSKDWKVELAQRDVKESGLSKANGVPIAYRPFDTRYTYYTGHSGGFHCRPRGKIMRHRFLQSRKLYQPASKCTSTLHTGREDDEWGRLLRHVTDDVGGAQPLKAGLAELFETHEFDAAGRDLLVCLDAGAKLLFGNIRRDINR